MTGSGEGDVVAEEDEQEDLTGHVIDEKVSTHIEGL